MSEKSAGGPWFLPDGFSVYPDARSRFSDPTCTDDPELPIPAPQLYAYSLPDLPERDPGRFRNASSGSSTLQPSVLEAALPESAPARADGGPWAQSSWPPTQLASYQAGIPPPQNLGMQSQINPQTVDADDGSQDLPIQPIPKEIWQSLPPKCLARMFEFESVRSEYDRTFGQEPGDDQRDQSQRLALEDIVQLAQINSREYQTQKETLYNTALALSLQRFDFDLKFATGGNRSAANYRHNRNAGVTVNTLGIPTTLTSDRVLATGGDFLARFANDVVLTFNGPEGFAADVGSRLFFDLSQSVFQRDIRFEVLTQAERRVVYAARDYARFRKTLFTGLAATYYDLLLTYRGIEIASQDYFSNLRGFNQAEAEHEHRGVERFEVDQFEQRALASRSSLIRACNSLEQSLDGLKLEIGLPPELPLNLDLIELEELTLRDEVTVVAERLQRAQRRLINVRSRPEPQRDELLNEAIRLVTEALSLQQLRQRRGEDVTNIRDLQTRLALMRTDVTRMQVDFKREVLVAQKDAESDDKFPPPELLLIYRTMDLVDSLLTLTRRELEVARWIGADPSVVNEIQAGLIDLGARHDELSEWMRPKRNRGEDDVENRVEAKDILERIPELTRRSDDLLVRAEGLSLEADALMPPRRIDPEGEFQATLRQVDELIARGQELLTRDVGGLVPVEIDMDDAMLTALTLRYDLMNEREQMADVWRRVKLTADDLKSILNLNASQTIRTRSDVNRPFDFTFDDSTTQLSMTVDAPLNRRLQRNLYRRQLINYNQAFRNLLALEDGIKFSIRNDLRDLSLQREQYRIAVPSAALAYDRVVSTRKQFQLDYGNITARDVLESQQAYTESLVALARAHIQYIQRRITLFLDLELLEVDQGGFWPQLYDEDYQPTTSYQIPDYCCPVYGELPPGVCYSKHVKRMLHVPAGQSVIFRPAGDHPGEAEEIPPPEPFPAPAEETPDMVLPTPTP